MLCLLKGPLPEDYPRITVPSKMMERLERQKVRLAQEKAARDRQKLKSAVVTSKRDNLSSFKGQNFKEFDARQLSSHGWKHRNCGYDHFTIHARGSVSSRYVNPLIFALIMQLLILYLFSYIKVYFILIYFDSLVSTVCLSFNNKFSKF